MQQQDPILSISQLDVALGGQAILKGIQLTAFAGELVAVLGPNGAGKSTLLRTISGQVGSRRGKVKIRGRDPARSAAARRSLGLVPQRIALFEKLTARENLLAFGALMQVGGRKARMRADELMERVQLKHRMNEPVKNLSGGMQRRVNIAAALMHRPSLLVLDEPTVGLDYEAQAGIVELLQSLKDEGVSVLLVTHHLDEAEALADRLAILVKGRIRALGVPAQLIQHVFQNLRDIKLVAPSMSDGSPVTNAPLGLENLGLFPDSKGGTWSGVLPADDPRLRKLLDAVGRGDLVAGEFTVRRAGLEMLLARCVYDAEQERA